MRLYAGDDGVENRLQAMRGDAARAPDLTDGILSRMADQRPFADQRTLRLRRWGRLVGIATACGLTLCAGLVAVQWSQIAPGLARPQPIASVVRSAVAEVKAGTETIKAVPARFAAMVQSREPKTDSEDMQAVRAVTANVLVPMSTALRVLPSTDLSTPSPDLAQRVIASGQRVLDQAGRFASSFKPMAGGGSGDSTGSFAERLERAVGGRPLGDGGPQ